MRWAEYQAIKRAVIAFNGRVCSGKTGEFQGSSFQSELEGENERVKSLNRERLQGADMRSSREEREVEQATWQASWSLIAKAGDILRGLPE